MLIEHERAMDELRHRHSEEIEQLQHTWNEKFNGQENDLEQLKEDLKKKEVRSDSLSCIVFLFL